MPSLSHLLRSFLQRGTSMAWLKGTPLEHEDDVLLEEKQRHAELRRTLDLAP